MAIKQQNFGGKLQKPRLSCEAYIELLAFVESYLESALAEFLVAEFLVSNNSSLRSIWLTCGCKLLQAVVEGAGFLRALDYMPVVGVAHMIQHLVLAQSKALAETAGEDIAHHAVLCHEKAKHVLDFQTLNVLNIFRKATSTLLVSKCKNTTSTQDPFEQNCGLFFYTVCACCYHFCWQFKAIMQAPGTHL